MDGDAHARGRELIEKLSPGFAERLGDSIGSIAPDFVDYTVDIAFGEIYSRPGLDIRSRQIATISALVTLGAFEQLRTHLGICRTIGMTSDEVAEVLMQLAIYAGWPRVLSSLAVAAEVYALTPREG